MAEVVIQINQTGKPVVAIDIPTGLDADSGKAEGPVVRAELTVTFAAWKTGFDQPGAEQYTGRIELVDIGIDAELAYEMSRGS
jgi:NAD(P)H-hydrate epimerase